MLVYKDLKNNVCVNAEERKYILQDTHNLAGNRRGYDTETEP